MFNALIVTTFREAVIKVGKQTLVHAMDTLIDDVVVHVCPDITNCCTFCNFLQQHYCFLLGLFQKPNYKKIDNKFDSIDVHVINWQFVTAQPHCKAKHVKYVLKSNQLT